eukprot:GHVS01027321.1.p1 GENE.GHVS01027321.1~~GHVS01027321.1.p1  ORF type:complete len:1144 (-),score=209.02 GHVS01027321.1:157-3588(-)
MAYRAVIDVFVQFGNFRNVDLFHQGLYGLSCRMYTPKPVEDGREGGLKEGKESKGKDGPSPPPSSALQYEACIPYSHSSHDGLGDIFDFPHHSSLSSRSSNTPLPSSSLNHHHVGTAYIHERAQTFFSRSFLIRYADEEVRLNDLCEFRLELDALDLFYRATRTEWDPDLPSDTRPLVVEVDLLFADISSKSDRHTTGTAEPTPGGQDETSKGEEQLEHGGPDSGERSDSSSSKSADGGGNYVLTPTKASLFNPPEFRVVSTQIFRLHNFCAGMHDVCCVAFDETHCCTVDLVVHSCLLDFRYRLNPISHSPSYSPKHHPSSCFPPPSSSQNTKNQDFMKALYTPPDLVLTGSHQYVRETLPRLPVEKSSSSLVYTKSATSLKSGEGQGAPENGQPTVAARRGLLGWRKRRERGRRKSVVVSGGEDGVGSSEIEGTTASGYCYVEQQHTTAAVISTTNRNNDECYYDRQGVSGGGIDSMDKRTEAEVKASVDDCVKEGESFYRSVLVMLSESYCDQWCCAMELNERIADVVAATVGDNRKDGNNSSRELTKNLMINLSTQLRLPGGGSIQPETYRNPRECFRTSVATAISGGISARLSDIAAGVAQQEEKREEGEQSVSTPHQPRGANAMAVVLTQDICVIAAQVFDVWRAIVNIHPYLLREVCLRYRRRSWCRVAERLGEFMLGEDVLVPTPIQHGLVRPNYMLQSHHKTPTTPSTPPFSHSSYNTTTSASSRSCSMPVVAPNSTSRRLSNYAKSAVGRPRLSDRDKIYDSVAATYTGTAGGTFEGPPVHIGDLHAQIAEALRRSRHLSGLEPLPVEDLRIIPKTENQPVVFQQCYYHRSDDSGVGASALMRGGVLRAAPTDRPVAKGPGVHLFVLVHGFQGSSFDMRLVRNTLCTLYTEAVVVCSCGNQETTEGDIAEMGLRLAEEVLEFASEWCPNGTVDKLSFIAHSLGGLIVRAAMKHLGLFSDRLFSFITFSSPHLGYAHNANKLVDAGIWVLKKWRKSVCLQQLTMSDHKDPKQTLLYALSLSSELHKFQNICLVSSYQDQYAPFDSARIELNATINGGKANAGGGASPSYSTAYEEMAYNLLSDVPPEKLTRLDVNFRIPDKTLDSFIGRTAHIQFLECQPLMRMILLTYTYLFV